MNVFVHTAEGFPADVRDRILDRLREKHPGARVQRLDAGKADRILVFGDEPEYVRFFRKTGTPTVVYRADGTHDVFDERVLMTLIRTELDGVEVEDAELAARGRGIFGARGYDERRNTSRVFAVAPGAADDAVETSRAWQAEQDARRAAEVEDGQLSLGEALRDDGIRRADEGAEDGWKAAADEALRSCLGASEITTDDVWRVLDARGVDRPREPRAMAGVLQRARSAGLIEPTETFVSSRRPEHHAGPIRVWKVAGRVAA